MQIYAEISNRMRRVLDYGDYELNLPPTVTYVRRRGSRALHIDIEDETLATEVKGLLYESGISFQEEKDIDTFYGARRGTKGERGSKGDKGIKGDRGARWSSGEGSDASLV